MENIYSFIYGFFYFFVSFIITEKMPFRIFVLKWGDMLVKFAFFSMQTYLTDVWELSFTQAAAFLNIWGAISKIFPLCSRFLADCLVGHFKMILISSKACVAGIVLVTMSTPPVLAHATGTCKEYDSQCIGHTHRVMFYTGMALLALGIGGHAASISPFSKEQCLNPLDLFRRRNPFYLFLLYTIIAGFFGFHYIKQWVFLFGVPGMCLVCATVVFLTGCGRCKYRMVKLQGSPLSDVFRVFVAAARKISQPFPDNIDQLYMKNDEGNSSYILTRRFPRWLEKAAIILPGEQSVEYHSRWRLCSLKEVEATKFVARVIPMGATFIVCTIVSSAGNTFFVEQASHMNRNIGKWKVPSQVLLALFYFVKLKFSGFARSRIRYSENYGRPGGIATAMVLSILCCVTAAGIEIERLKVVKHRGLVKEPDKVIPMHAFWLAFPFFLLAAQDSILRESIVAYCDWECPDVAMSRYISHFADALFGLGLVYSVLSVYVLGKISEIGGRQSWFQDSLNKSRLDLYYWALAASGALNLLVFIPLASLYNHPINETNDYINGR